ncbi:MAG: hypothetical protein KAT70_03285, partial [Thermoplasmata archaeon]|nr:hypothetical protein [Thermoplasmata archaeon]
MFYMSYALLLLAISLMFFGRQNDNNLFFLLAVVFSLRLITIIRIPSHIIEHGDESYELQILQSIIHTGAIQPEYLTNVASYSYQYWLGLEGFLSSISILSGVEPKALLKWTGLFVGLLTILFIERFYFNIFGKRAISIPAAILVGTCPVLMQFDVHTVHQTLALTFFSFFLYTLTKRENEWSLLGILSLLCLLLTHHLTTVMFLLLIVAAFPAFFVSSVIIRKRPRFPFGRLHILLLLGAGVVAILAYDLLLPSGSGVGSSGAISIRPQSDTRPLWMAIIIITGLGALSLCGTSSFFKQLARFKRGKGCFHSRYMVLFFAGILSTCLFFAGVMMGPALPIKWRGLFYLFLFLAPFLVISLKTEFIRCEGYARKMLPIAMIFLILLPSVFLGVERDFYDTDAPYRQEDIRYNLEEWDAMGQEFHALDTGERIWGVVRGSSFIGGQGQTWYSYIRTDDTASWLSQHRGEIMVIRT